MPQVNEISWFLCISLFCLLLSLPALYISFTFFSGKEEFVNKASLTFYFKSLI